MNPIYTCICINYQVRDRSSYFSKESNIRKEGSFIYEEFLATDGSDVKVDVTSHVTNEYYHVI